MKVQGKKEKTPNFLKAVFWDYPEFADFEKIEEIARAGFDDKLYRWVMKRFLEYGRVVDTLQVFSIDEIAKGLEHLPLSPYAKRKWRRIVEVYAGSSRE